MDNEFLSRFSQPLGLALYLADTLLITNNTPTLGYHFAMNTLGSNYFAIIATKVESVDAMANCSIYSTSRRRKKCTRVDFGVPP